MKGNVVYISLLKNGIPLPRNTYSRTLEPLITFIELLCRPRPYSSIGPYHCQSISSATAAGLRQTSRRNQPIYRGTMGQHDSIVSRRLCIHSLPSSSRSENAFFSLPFCQTSAVTPRLRERTFVYLFLPRNYSRVLFVDPLL